MVTILAWCLRGARRRHDASSADVVVCESAASWLRRKQRIERRCSPDDRALTSRALRESGQSTSSQARLDSNAAAALRARSSTRRANDSRWRLSTKYEATPETTQAITKAHSTETLSATANHSPATITNEPASSSSRRAVWTINSLTRSG